MSRKPLLGRKTVVQDNAELAGLFKNDISMISNRKSVKSTFNGQNIFDQEQSNPGNNPTQKTLGMNPMSKFGFAPEVPVFSTDKKLSIFTEPDQSDQDIITIPNLEEEQRQFRQKDISQKPTQIFLDHCNQYAKKNLIKNELQIQDYQFRYEDIRKGLICEEVTEMMKQQNKQGIPFEPTTLQDNAFAKLFRTVSKKLFTDYIFIDKKQYILVKTWQKIHFDMPSHDNLPTKGINSINSRMDYKAKGGAAGQLAKAPVHSDDEDEEAQQFYIKTLQILDKEGNEVSDPILVEQVYGTFDTYRLYDISTLHFQDSLYYFKRIYVNDDDVSDNLDRDGKKMAGMQSPLDMQLDKLKKGAAMTPDDLGNQSIGGSIESYSGRNEAVTELQDKEQTIDKDNSSFDEEEKQMFGNKKLKKKRQKTMLMLFCYDLRNDIENAIHTVKIDESKLAKLDELNNSLNQKKIQNLLGKYNSQKKSVIIKVKQEIKKRNQFNITFSQEFGPDSKFESVKEKYDNEEEFLQGQFFCIQQYVQNRQKQYKFRIYQISDYTIPDNFEKSLIYESTIGLSKEDQITDLNRQVQFLNNIVTRNDIDMHDETNHFLITNMFTLIQIDIHTKSLNRQNPSAIKEELYPRKYTDLFQKIWNSGGIIPQMATIKNNDDEIKEDKINQYFFVDSRNEIQLLFPNTKQKVESLRRIEQINDIFKIKIAENLQRNKEYKKIIYIDYLGNSNVDKQGEKIEREFVNVVQHIGHLQKILNHENMHQAQSLVFVKDIEGQTLYITEPASSIILLFRMSVQNIQNAELCDEKSDKQALEQQVKTLAPQDANQSGNDDRIRNASLPIARQKTVIDQQKNEDPKDNGQTAGNVKQIQIQSEYCNIDNQMSSQGTNSMQLQEETENRIKITSITDLNHLEPYIQYQKGQQGSHVLIKKIRDEHDEQDMCEKLEPKEKQNHIFIDDFNGNKVKVRTYNSETTEYSTISQNLKLILYQMTSDKKFTMFLFGVYNVKMQGAGAQSELKIIKKSYILVRKTKQELTKIFDSNLDEELIKKDEKVILIKSYFDMSYHGFNDIQDYQFDESENIEEEKKLDQTQFRDIELLLASGNGIEQERLNFIPFIYQERLNGKSNMFIVFDIIQNRATSIISVSPSLQNVEYLYEDENGHNMFMLTRSSEIEETYEKKSMKTSEKSCIQKVKYQVFNLYRERIGRIQGGEFLITHTAESTNIQTIGLKHLIFSKDCMQAYSWEKIRDSKAIPYLDEFNFVKGCTIQMKTHKDNDTDQDIYRIINLKDQDQTNIYFMKTDVVFTGQKKFTFQVPSKNIDKNKNTQLQIDPRLDLYMIAVCTQFNRKYTELNILDRSEAYTCLNMVQELILRMRIPDLEYIVLNSFENLQEKDFFRSQLILQGKSICDICITDQKAVRKAASIKVDPDDGQQQLKGSIMEQIIKDDVIRRQAMMTTKFYPEQLLIQIDLNFMGTIGRAFHLVSYQSVKILLEKCIDEIGSVDYHKYIMYDLNLILDSKQVRVNDFFEVDNLERKEGAEAACNLEILIKNNELPQFSDVPFEYFNLSNDQIHQSSKTKQISNFLDLDIDLSQNIIEREEIKPLSTDRSFETEFYYIDYQMMIIDQKIRCIRQDQEIPKFDDLYFAEIIMKKSKDEINNSFFLQESVQKIINAQWDRTKSFQRRIFFMYFFFYCIPMCVSCFKVSDYVDDLMFYIAFVPIVMLLMIELIQVTKDGWDYFQGWNNLDFIQLLLFFFLLYLRMSGYEDKLESVFPILKLINILLAFAKMGFFVRIFEDYGFLVQMVIFVIYSLIPFMIVYLIFIVIFSICNVVLKMDIDEEVSEAQKLSVFQKHMLQALRTGLGELGMPAFSQVLEEEDTIFRTMNIYLLWILWFLTTFVLLIFMLNFLIAVITSAYQRVMNYQKIISYKHKADLNYETYMLLSKFIELKTYRYLVLMSSTSVRMLIEDEFDEKAEQFKKFIQRETTSLKHSHEQLSEHIQNIKSEQTEIEKYIHLQFDELRVKRENMQKEIFQEVERVPANAR